MFGKQWLDVWEGAPMDAVKASWREALASYNPDTILAAVASMQREGRAFPPNQTQFVALCRQFARHGAHRNIAITDQRREPPPGGFQTLRDALKRAQVPRK
jgi:hypothetical protein